MNATFVLIHGAGSDSWYWHAVAPLLRAEGHEVIAPDLPCDDDGAGLDEYTDTVVSAIGDRRDNLVLVAQSMAGFTAPMVCERVPVELLILVAAMTPKPGEPPGAWWEATGQPAAQRELDLSQGRDPDAEPDLESLFMHDIPDDVKAEALTRDKEQSGTPFEKPWPLAAWPDVPTRFLLCTDDRLFPAAFQRKVAAERLGIMPDEMPGGHLPALAHPRALATRLLDYWRLRP
ncbi:alpha/beta hydrolase [Saccharomonospora sp. NPDC006951]